MFKVRMQIRLTEEQAAGLRALSRKTGTPPAGLIRQAVDKILGDRREERDEEVRRALGAVGRYSSGLTDVSTRHDDYLAEAYRE